MLEKYLQLLRDQIEKLDAKDFNLEAWKKSAIVILERIFGENNKKISEIEKIKYDQGSWVLRDATGTASAMDTCKSSGRVVLEAAIFELENFGLKETSESNIIKDQIIPALQDEITGSQFKELKIIIQRDIDIEEKKKLLYSKFKGYGENVCAKILSNIISDQKISDSLKSI